MLVFGDPGTLKTRRALQMPGPLYVIDLENGAADYGELVDPERDFYLATKSHREVSEALNYLATLDDNEVGTIIVDPITVVWQSIQHGHIQRVLGRGFYGSGRNKKPVSEPEEVPFDVGVWGKLKRTHGDIVASLLAMPANVIMVARGKEKIDQNGRPTGYGYEGEKSLEFLANVVMATRRGGDVILKDRTGTFRESTQEQERVDFRAFLDRTSRIPHPVQTDTEAAQADAEEFHPTWLNARDAFVGTIEEVLSTDIDTVAGFCATINRPPPWLMDHDHRTRLLAWITGQDGNGGADRFMAYVNGN